MTTATNPLTSDVAATMYPQPCSLVIFGGSGDLSRRKLLPAIYNLSLDGVLPTNFAVVGFAINDFTDESYRAFAREGIEKFSRRPLDPDHWADFEKMLYYVRGSFDDRGAFTKLRERLEQLEPGFGIPGNHVFYLAIPPSLIDQVANQLQSAGLVTSPAGSGPFSRIIVEKPIGRDLDSAKEVNATLGKVFDESQIFR